MLYSMPNIDKQFPYFIELHEAMNWYVAFSTLFVLFMNFTYLLIRFYYYSIGIEYINFCATWSKELILLLFDRFFYNMLQNLSSAECPDWVHCPNWGTLTVNSQRSYIRLTKDHHSVAFISLIQVDNGVPEDLTNPGRTQDRPSSLLVDHHIPSTFSEEK